MRECHLTGRNDLQGSLAVFFANHVLRTSRWSRKWDDKRIQKKRACVCKLGEKKKQKQNAHVFKVPSVNCFSRV